MTTVSKASGTLVALLGALLVSAGPAVAKSATSGEPSGPAAVRKVAPAQKLTTRKDGAKPTPAAPAQKTTAAAPQPEAAVAPSADPGAPPPLPAEVKKAKTSSVFADAAADTGLGDLFASPAGAAPAEAVPPAPSARKHKRRAEPAAPKKGLDFELEARTTARPSGEEVIRFEEQSLKMAQIRRVVREHQRELEHCYERAVIRGKLASGELILHFTIAPNGQVSGASFSAEGVSTRKLDRCMAGHIKRWKFPAADAETNVDYPLLLQVAEEGAY